jgi:hypothetical protein
MTLGVRPRPIAVVVRVTFLVLRSLLSSLPGMVCSPVAAAVQSVTAGVAWAARVFIVALRSAIWSSRKPIRTDRALRA